MKSGTKAPFLSRFVSRGVRRKILQENGWDVSSSQLARATRLVASEADPALSMPRGHRPKLTLKQQAHIRAWYFYCSRVSPNRTNAKGAPIRFLQDSILNIYTLYKQSCLEQQLKPVSYSSFFRYKPVVCKKPKKVDDKCDTCGRLASVERDMMLLLPTFLCCCGQNAEPPREPPSFSDMTPELEEELLKDPTLSEFIDRDLLRVTHENPELEDFDRFITFDRKCEVLAENFEKNVSECMHDHESLHPDMCVQMRKLLRARPALKAHKFSSKRQKASFQRAIEALTIGKCLIVMDFKENLSLGRGPEELSSHFRNRPQRQLLGAAVLYVDEDGCLKKRYVSFLSKILNKNANFVYQAILHLVSLPWFNFKNTSFWFDKGSTHFWNLEMCCYLLSNFADMGYSVNFFGAGHDKNLVDGHFSLLSRWKKLAEVRTRVLSSEQLISEWKQMLKASNLRRIEADLPTLDIDFVDFNLSHDKWVKVPKKLDLSNFKIWYRFERLAGEEKIRCKLHSNAILKKDFPLKFVFGKPRKGDTWKEGFASWTNLSIDDYFSKYYDNEMRKRGLFQSAVVEMPNEESKEEDVLVDVPEEEWDDLMPEVSNPETDQDDPDADYEHTETAVSVQSPSSVELERESGGVENVELDPQLPPQNLQIFDESPRAASPRSFGELLFSGRDVDDVGLGSQDTPDDSMEPPVFGQDSPSHRALASALSSYGGMPPLPSDSDTRSSPAPAISTASSSSSSAFTRSSLSPLPMSSHLIHHARSNSESEVDEDGFKVPKARQLPPATPSRATRPRAMSFASPLPGDENTPPRDDSPFQSPSTPSRRMSIGDSPALVELTPASLNPNAAPRTPLLATSRRSRRHRVSDGSSRSRSRRRTPIRQTLNFDQLSEAECSDHSDVDGFLDA